MYDMKLKTLLFALPLLLVGLSASACPGGKANTTATATAAPACSQMKASQVAHNDGHCQCAGMRHGKHAHMHATAGTDMPACCKMKVAQASYSEKGKACSANGNCSMTSLGLALLVSLGAIGGSVYAFTKLRI